MAVAPITAWAVTERGVISPFYVSDSPRSTMARWLAMKGRPTNDDWPIEKITSQFNQLTSRIPDTGLIEVNIAPAHAE